jgi:hypothetical protein
MEVRERQLQTTYAELLDERQAIYDAIVADQAIKQREEGEVRSRDGNPRQ